MSTTARQTTDRRVHTVTTAEEYARDLTDLYTKLIHEAPTVCSNCHHRIRAKAHAESNTYVRNGHENLVGRYREQNTLGTGDDELGPLRRGGSGTAGYEDEWKDEYGAIRRYDLRTFCGHCGQPGGRAKDDTPSKQEMLDAVGPLVDRLDEYGVPVNPDLLQYLIGYLRSQRDLDGSETEVWRAAVAKAVENARPRDCLRCSGLGGQ